MLVLAARIIFSLPEKADCRESSLGKRLMQEWHQVAKKSMMSSGSLNELMVVSEVS